jgi:hypothetical protein
MARPEVTERRTGAQKLSTNERDAWSIPEFCARHSISRSTYYNLKRSNKAPHETRIMPADRDHTCERGRVVTETGKAVCINAKTPR